MKKIAFVFPGQGAQFLKMSQDFSTYDYYVKEASMILGEDIDYILTNDSDKLNQTKYTQPLLVLATIVAYEAVKLLGYEPEVVAGFSLGEYSAYYAANLFDFKDTLKMVQARARFMDDAANKTKGTMAAIIGLDEEKIEAICHDCSDDENIVSPANYNSKGQTVISGHEASVFKAIELAKAHGARLTKQLQVSGAFHSKLMLEASENFAKYCQQHLKLKQPTYPLYLNTTAKPLIVTELLNQMVAQIHQPVLFYEMIEQMIADGVTHFVEIGPGQVLSGLIKKINKDVMVTHIQSQADLNRLEQIYET